MSRTRDICPASALAKQGRMPAFMACMLLVSFLAALAPYNVQAKTISTETPACNPVPSLNIVRSEAMASQLTPGDTAKEFIKKMAQSSGLGAGDLVITSLGIATVGSGMVLASSQGQQWGMTAAQALSNLVEAADYPDYETLTNEQKTLWGSKENYDSAKYVSLMNGLGFKTEYERFEQMQGSGGANFEFSDDAQDRLNQFYRIGSLWQSRFGVLFGDISGLITNKQVIKDFPAGGIAEVGQITKEDFEDWPVSSINSLQYSIGNRYQLYTSSSGYYYTLTTSEGVYCLLYANSSHKYTYTLFSLGSFSYGTVMNTNEDSSPTPINPAPTVTVNGHSFHYYQTAVTGNPTSNNLIGIVNPVNSTPDDSSMRKFAELVLFGGGSGGNTEPEMIPNYPPDGDVSNDQRIYFPEDGLTPESTWQNFTDPQTPNPDNPNPYNPDNQSGSIEWNTDTEENLLNASEFPLNKLFPFSLLYDITTLANKVKSVTVEQQTSGAYDVISIPINLPWLQDTIDIDLGDLHDLLLGTRVFIQILLATSLLFATIRLWSGVLGGQ